MNLERICIKTHLRTHWQAIDLGFHFARQWYFALWALWAIPFALVAIPVSLLLADNLALTIFVLWWLKPVFDRAPLHFASRVLFSEKLTIGSTLKQFYQINKFDWLPWLIFRRLNLTRSFDLPVTQLEQLSGSKRKLRLKTLHGRGNGAAMALTFVCILFESTLYFGSLFLIAFLVPDQIEFNLFFAAYNAESWFNTVNRILILIPLTIVAPFYICAGFTLYINRRIELEAWDVEIQFRKMSANYSKDNITTKVSAVTLPVIFALIFQLTNGLPAAQASPSKPELNTSDAQQQPATPIDSAHQAKDRINAVMASELFNQHEEVTRWRLKHNTTNEVEKKNWIEQLLEWIKEKFGSDENDTQPNKLDFSTVTLFVEITLWLTPIALALWFIYRYRNNIASLLSLNSRPKKKQHQPQVTTLFGLQIGNDKLPSDVVHNVEQLISNNQYRDALSLLYRASLTLLIEQKKIRFSESTTEVECLNKVRQIDDGELSQYIEQLTVIWQSLAYGHQQPNPQSIRNLCADYKVVFNP